MMESRNGRDNEGWQKERKGRELNLKKDIGCEDPEKSHCGPQFIYIRVPMSIQQLDPQS
jgi:hypothetical protein